MMSSSHSITYRLQKPYYALRTTVVHFLMYYWWLEKKMKVISGVSLNGKLKFKIIYIM